ncbi:dimethylsulfoxide reductase, chain B [Bacillus sp. FJAT-27225]|uniref:DMSO/selenate family reductase complex B subunit n=1 Tax=Bacillus sp. FJAT-27225 TaxID=1743144 RepID=UPI00080C251A|nr:DMSO/selenate family reductase complex B subunit [Bacillus sp. FJAT-27225]OCA81502.1 dimethylsulfoxide reductase, chain B [Bacillus sp. FJAT-27225]
MAVQLGFYVNQSRCAGCNACFMACKDKNDLDDERAFRRVWESRSGAFQESGNGLTHTVKAAWLSLSCNHCDDPKCVTSCPTGAMKKNKEDGVVWADVKICRGVQFCIKECPYGAPQLNKKTFRISKCDMCADLREKGEEPACVAACPYGNIEIGPIDELRKKYGNIAVVEGLPDPSITKPNLVITPHK